MFINTGELVMDHNRRQDDSKERTTLSIRESDFSIAQEGHTSPPQSLHTDLQG